MNGLIFTSVPTKAGSPSALWNEYSTSNPQKKIGTLFGCLFFNNYHYLDRVLVPPVEVEVRVEPDEERVEPLVLPEERVLELLSRRTVVVLPLVSVVLTVVRVVPLLFTRVSIVVDG